MSFILLGILNSQAAGAVGAGAYDLLETTVLTSSASSVSFTGLDSYTDYKHLQIRTVMQRASAFSGTVDLELVLNNDTGNNYSRHALTGNGTSVNARENSNQDTIAFIQTITAEGIPESYGAMVLDVLDFSSSNKNTTVRALTGAIQSDNEVNLISGAYINTAAITSMRFEVFDGFTTGSRFSLYGIK